MKIFITGQSGFVGGWVRDSIATDARGSGLVVLPADRCNLLDRAGLHEMVEALQPDAVLHLAAQSSVAQALRDPAATAEVNVMGTINLLDALEAAGFSGRFLFVGSSECYGLVHAHALPLAETAELAPRNPYAASKVAAEQFVLERARRGRLDAVCTRSFNHTGPRQSVDFVLPKLARQVAEIAHGLRQPEILAGDLDVTRDFLDVRDVAAAYLLLLQQGERGGIYNVCSGQESRLADLLDTLLRLAGVQASVGRDPALLRAAEQRRVCGDGSRLRALGWAPARTMTETLQSLLNYWQETIKKEAT